MADDARQHIRGIFAQALEVDAAGRAEFVHQASAGDATVAREVEALLLAYEQAGRFLGSPTNAPTAVGGGEDDRTALVSASASSSAATIASPMKEGPGARIGAYKILQLIGEGGFGSVYMAEQSEPVQRRVALKIIKLGMDTKQVIARFEAERQALAMMDHPNIAKVLDAGATDAGRPYFVMELVKGEPITDYCDRQNLSIDQRLGLFAQVCNAVQHSHQKGIIHRDIKPSNVLVSTQDGRPFAKILDFGIAKATAARLTEKTLFTEHRTLIGTPEYMSPEQAEGTLDIDTRTDVYSLGVLLYELLTGATPFDSEKLRSAAYGELQRIIREVDPPNPSTRLSQSADTIASVAARRQTEPRKLGSIIRGELDWIVMKALEKDRQRRYETANGLAMDIARYLAGEAVVAAPPSTAYRVSKFVKRHRAVVVTASLVAIALLLGLVAFAWQAKIARYQRDLAINAEKAEAQQRRVAEDQRTVAQEQRSVATQEAARAKAVSSFVEQMLLAADPAQTGGSREVTVLELLDKASIKAGKTLKDQPIVEASARTLLGNTLVSLGKVDAGVAELKRSLEIRRNTTEAATFPQAETYRALGLAYAESQNFQAALEAFQQAQAIVLNFVDAGHAKEAAIGYVDVARAYLNLSRFPEADQSLNEAEALIDRKIKEGDAEVDSTTTRAFIADIRSMLAADWRNDPVLAESLAEQRLALTRQSDDPVSLMYALNNLAVKKMTSGKLDEAQALYQEAIDSSTREFGQDNHRVAMFSENLANLYYRKKDYAQALAMLREVLRIRETIFGPQSTAEARTRLNMGSIANNTGEFALALELADGVLPILRSTIGEKNQDFATALRIRAVALKGLDDLDGALREYQAALAIYDATGHPAFGGRLRTLLNMAEIQCLQGHPEQAQQTADLALKAVDPDKPDQAKWIKDFQDLLATCAKGEATTSPATTPQQPASRPN